MSSRRAFLKGLLAAGAAPSLSWADAGSPDFLAAARLPSKDFALFGLRSDGSLAFQVPLPARAHAGTRHPSRPVAVVFARRPGAYALVIDCVSGSVVDTLTPPASRQFNGHGAFLLDGNLLVTSEQIAETSEGRLGLWSVPGYRRLGEIPTHGIGPHEILRLADDASVVVANGGIATDPTDRTKLNVPDMRPNLAYLSVEGEVLEIAEAGGLAQDSIRHLALAPDGQVAFAMQWEGAADEIVPLLGLHRRGESIRLAQAPGAEQTAMQGYAGSIAFMAGGAEVAITSPRGGRVHRFAADGTFLGSFRRADVCGLAGIDGGFLASDGLGGLIRLDGDDATLLVRHEVEWDNHIIKVA